MVQKSPKKSKPYLSPTQINMYVRCGEQYRRRYIEKESLPPGISMLKGTSIHRGAEKNFSQKIESHADLDKKSIVDYSVSVLEETIKHEGLLLNSEEESRGKSVVVDEAKISTVELAGLLMDEVTPKYQPIEVEQRYQVELESSSHDLNGIIDMKIESGQIMDLKTSAKSWSQERLDKDLQFTFYGLMDRVKTGVNPKPMILENLVTTKKPKTLTLETNRTQEDFDVLVNRMNAIVEGINKGIFIPAQPDSWICSEKFCGYALSCKFFVKKS